MNLRKSILGLAACVALAGLFAWSSTIQARPIPALRNADNGVTSLRAKAKGGINASAGSVCESTGFEAVEATCGWETGFMCGGNFVGICTAPASGVCTGDPSTDQNCCIDDPNPLNGWYLSISSRHCNEPHVDTINPASGAQHLRLDRDPLGGDPPGCTGFAGACRVSAFTPTAGGPQPIGQTLIDFDIAMGDTSPGQAPFGSSGQLLGVADNEPGSSGVSIIIGFDAQAVVFAYNNATSGYEGVGFLTGNGVYDHLQIDSNPCQNTLTYTLSDSTGATTGQVVQDFSGVEKTYERGIFTNDNAGFFWDIDNYSVQRLGSCPSQCGNDSIEGFLGEECDGTDDADCPGRCTPPDHAPGGPGTPTECKCIRPCNLCDTLDPATTPECFADNGVNGPFLTHGGFFSYTPDGPFTAIDTCGSDFDTTLFIGGNDFCTTFDSVINDECADLTGTCSDGNHDPANCDPFASCFNNNTNFESCACVATTAGTEIFFWAAAFPGATPPAGSHLMVTITKALSCGPTGEAIPNGACCDGVTGTCTDNVLAADCAGPSDTYTPNKLCSMVSCVQDTGGCCDMSPGLGGQCTAGVLPQDCSGSLQVFSKLDDTCGGNCAEITGACCDSLTGNCFESIQGDCPETASHTTWTLGAACADVNCQAAMGACCDSGTNDPTVATCSQTTLAQCDCARCTWTKAVACDDIECLPDFQTIPTVSEWGLVVLALLLLVGGKIYFGRREEATA